MEDEELQAARDAIHQRRPKPIRLWLIVMAAAALLLGWVFFRAPHAHFMVRSCLKNVQGLKEQAPVRLAGVDVGQVEVVRARPDDRTCPAEVRMALNTTYELKIPKDSIVSIETAGLLGASYVEIDSSKASGSPIDNGGTLPSAEKQPLTLEDLIKVLKSSSERKRLSESADSPHRKAE